MVNSVAACAEDVLLDVAGAAFRALQDCGEPVFTASTTALFSDLWQQAPEGAFRDAASAMLGSCLVAAENRLAKQEPLIGPAFLEALAVLRCRRELERLPHPRGCESDGAAEKLRQVTEASGSTFMDGDHFLKMPPASFQQAVEFLETPMSAELYLKAPLDEIIDEYLCVEVARATCSALSERGLKKTTASLTHVWRALQELKLPYPGSRGARDLQGALLEDLQVVAAFSRCLRECFEEPSEGRACWLADFARAALGLLLQARQPASAECVALAVSALHSLGCSEKDTAVVSEARAFLATVDLRELLASAIGTTSVDRPLAKRSLPVLTVLSALQPRGSPPGVASNAGALPHARAALREASPDALAAGRLPLKIYYLDLSWQLGVPEQSPGHMLPAVQQSHIGGPGGRGLFSLSGDCPAPVEILPDDRYGEGGFLSEEVYDDIMANDEHVSRYVVMETLGVWFRDEFTKGDLWGTIRPLAAALPGWLEEGRCTQEIAYDAQTQVYGHESWDRTCFVASDAETNLGAMANDRLYGKLTDIEDRKANNMVMVPCARPAPEDPEKVQIASMWIYPRHGWKWHPGSSVELTLGYAYEED
eukprot:TRINITY_DN44724_c0_g2_i1.p1 TRINITY_DN44724_c0_g2~~TRINITY_DN44724_c0_g2_i1.p1  ORF type:complete len:595 (-),score=128.19 TRINITY_DN44724_c0_g2_i1:8-1792(-)